VRFAFSDEQRELARTLRALLERECPPARVRAAWDAPDGLVPGLGARLGEMGITGMLAPEAQGGLGLGEVDLVLALEELGRAAVPGPVAETAAVAVPLLRDLGGALAERWLPEAAAGRATVVVAHEGQTLVDGAAAADVVLVVQGEALHALPRGAAGATWTVEKSVDGARRVARLAGGPLRDDSKVAEGVAAVAAMSAAFDRAALAAAAQLIGLGRRMLELTVDYVKVRKQFERPIGSFQAVKHHLADAVMALEFAAPMVYRAADSVARGDVERALHVSAAKAMASDAAELAAAKALQCHGAIGYAFEYDLHLWMKRSWALARSHGDSAWHRARVATALQLEENNDDGRSIHH